MISCSKKEVTDLKEKLRALIADTVFIPLFYLLRLFPIKKNKVVFSSFFGRGYGDCPARICDRLLSRRVDVDAVWVLSDPSLTLPSGVRSVHLRSFGWVYELATAAVWIDNCRKPPYVRKRRGQKYIQTWHGDVCVKAIEADAAETLSPRYVASAINDSKMADLVVSGCEWRTENIKSSFWYSGEILRAELYPPPRLDTRERLALRATLGVDPDTRIALYAPTFRKNGGVEVYDLDCDALISALNEKFGGVWCVVLRLHPNVAEHRDSLSYNECVKNGSVLPDVAPLLALSDVVLTDYSGLMFDVLRLKKPLFLYGNDLESYVREDRRLYFDLEKPPFVFSRSNAELIERIAKFDCQSYLSSVNDFVDSLGYYENDGVGIVCDAIEKMLGRNI